MAAYSILVGRKGDKREAVCIGDPREVNQVFKEAAEAGKLDGFESVEVVTSRSGRTKRKKFKPATARTGGASASEPEAPRKRGRPRKVEGKQEDARG